MVVSLQYLHRDLAEAISNPSGEKLLEPPLPSAWSRNYAVSQPSAQVIWNRGSAVPQPLHFPEPTQCFLSAIYGSLSTTNPLQASTITGSWLSALIRMQVLSYAATLDWIMNPLSFENDDRVTELSRMCSSLESSQGQILRIQENLPHIRRSDYTEAFLRLGQILDEARFHRLSIVDLIDNRFRFKSADAAELTVSQGRFAVACKIRPSRDEAQIAC